MDMARTRRSFLTYARHAAGANGGRRAAILICSLLVGCGGGLARADAPAETSAGALKQLSVEDLMNVEVTSVAKAPQKLLRAAASIQVITADDIRRSGATTIPEALRLADNLEVAQINSHDWAISARGFNADLANKLLVLIDGRVVYTPLYGGVLWDVQDYLLADIDRIEVISGPGGTLWGANAVNGVINIVTKSAGDTQGAYAFAAGGNELREQEGARYGATLAPDVYLRVYGKYTDYGDELTSTGANAEDAWHMTRGGFRMDAQPSAENAYTLQGDLYNGTEGDGSNLEAEGRSGGNVLGRWTHTASDGSSMSLQLYYDHTYLSDPVAASPAVPPYYSGFPASALTDNLDAYDVEFQHHFRWGTRQTLTWGLGYRLTDEADYDLSLVRFSPPVLEQALYSGFLQDEVRLAQDVYLTVGSKLEHSDYTGYEVEPSARLQWNVDLAQLLWAAVSRAVRTPSRYDHDLVTPTGLENAPPPLQFPTNYLQGNPDFVSEVLLAYEAGYRATLGPNLALSLSTFYNDYNDLRSITPTPATVFDPYPYPDIFTNNLEGDTYGLELSGSYQLLDWWRLHAGYDLLRENIHVRPGAVDAVGAGNETADPQQQVALRSSMDLPGRVSLDAALRWVDELHMDNGPTAGPVLGTVPSYFALDSRLGWQISQRLELAVEGRNLLHAEHIEYGFPSPSREDIGRSVFAKITWGF